MPPAGGLRAIPVLAALCAAGGCRGTAPERTPDLPGAVRVPASQFPLGEARAPAADPAGPVTHLGRHVFPQCHKMVVARVEDVARANLGAEVARIRETEVLWGPPEEDDAPFPVLCGASGLAPRPGSSALFLLRLLPRGQYEVLEVAPADDADGATRLRAFRTYLQIEAVDDPVHRRGLLLAYLRGAAGSSEAWTRSNAIREYAAFADAFPGALGPEDGAALARALPGLRDPEMKRLAQRALDAAPATARPRREPAASPAAGLASFEKRFEGAAADPRARAAAVAEAAAKLGAAAAPLVARGLDDRAPEVREASAAAAADGGVADAAPRLVRMAVLDDATPARAAAVQALGHLRAPSAVGTLGGLARSDPALARSALFALARIRDAAAIAELRALRGAAGPELARDVDFLLSEDFVRQERAMGAAWPDRR